MVAPLAVADPDESALWREYRATGSLAARNALLVRHQPVVDYWVRRLSARLPRHVDPDDLRGYGQLGLIAAAQGFDPGRGFKFVTYAAPRVFGAIIDHIREEDWVPRLTRARRTRLADLIAEADAAGDDPPDAAIVAKVLGVKPRVAERLLAAGPMPEVESLERVVIDGETRCLRLSDTIPADGRPGVGSDLDFHDWLESLLRGCAWRERVVIRLYYLSNLTMAEIARCVGVNEARVSQIHANLIARFKARLTRAAAP